MQYWWTSLSDIAWLRWALDPSPLVCDELAIRTYGNAGGQARARSQALLDRAMRKLHENAGGGEAGAQVTAWLAARDGQARYCPDWLLAEWRAHAEAVKEVLT